MDESDSAKGARMGWWPGGPTALKFSCAIVAVNPLFSISYKTNQVWTVWIVPKILREMRPGVGEGEEEGLSRWDGLSRESLRES
jgi:hypothetical protein